MKRENLWWKNTIIYELYVDKFAGNFRNLTTKLVYLKTLGIGCVWILPHYPSPMIDGGYDISDYRNIRKGLGTLEDFQEFINRAHELHIKVVIDLVLNHTSSDHPWFLEAKSSKSNSKRNYYLWNNDTNKFSLASNPFPHVSNSNWVYNKETDDYYYATFYQVQPDLNWDNPEVFSEMTRIIDFWLDKDVDGLRLDAIPRLIKREGTNCISLPETHKVIKRIREHIAGLTHLNNVMLDRSAF